MVLPPREWICNNVTSRLPALLCPSVTMRWWKSFPVWTVLSRRMTEWIPTVSMESQHFVDGLTSRDFSSIYTVRELLPDEVRSRLDGKWVFGKKRPLLETLKISLRKDLCAHGNTYCVQILWTLADHKSVKYHVAYMTKKIGKRSCSRLCVDHAQNLSCTVKYFQ